MATQDNSRLVQDVVTSIRTLEAFPHARFMDRLYSKTRAVAKIAVFRDHLEPVQPFGPDPESASIDIISVAPHLESLAVQSVVSAIGDLDDGTDKSGFRPCVHPDVAANQTMADILVLTPMLFAEHINWHLKDNKDDHGVAKPVMILDQLYRVAGLADAFKSKLMESKFVNGEIATDLARQDRTFSMSLLYICEYLYQGPGFTQIRADQFSSTKSKEVLTKWGTELLSAPSTSLDSKKILAGLAAVASIVLNPVTTGAADKPTVESAMRRAVMDNVFKPAVTAALEVQSSRKEPPPPKSEPASDDEHEGTHGHGHHHGHGHPGHRGFGPDHGHGPRHEARPHHESGPRNGDGRQSILAAPAVGSAVATAVAVAEAPITAMATNTNSRLEELITSDIQEFDTIGANNQAEWKSRKDTWIKAVVAKATAKSQTVRQTFNDFGRGFIIGVTLGMEDHQEWEETTWTGQDLANWMSQVKGSSPTLFTASNPNTVSIRTYNTDKPATCFIAGTKVETSSGDIAIEEIQEGTKILTDAVSQRFGIASDENVVAEVSGTVLVGFNDEGAFVTPGHIFHTTTGLRAVDPEMAKKENAWAEVGRLQKGHVLYRLGEDRRSYDLVQIHSIQIKLAPAQAVYGVHLREGDRSYHANGYLVSVNYPEITIKSVAKALAKLPKAERVKMLMKIEELSPVFRKLGIDGVCDVLRRELRGKWRQRIPRRCTGHLVNFKDLRRTYTLDPENSPLTDKNGPKGYHLPILNIHEGVVRLGIDIVPRAEFDQKDNCLRWSRPLGEGLGFEHGVFNFTNLGLTGRGAVLISKQENPSGLPSTIDERVVPFAASKANVEIDVGTGFHNDKVPMNHNMVTTAHLAAAPASFSQVRLMGHDHEARRRPEPHGADRRFPPPRPGPATPAPAPPHTSPPAPTAPGTVTPAPAPPRTSPPAPTVPGPVTPAPTVPGTATSTPAPPLTAPPAPVAPGPILPPTADMGIIDGEDYYDVVVDSAEWPKDTVRTSATTPISMGKVALATYHTDGNKGYSVPTIVVPILDQLQTDLNKGRTGTMAVSRLYKSVVQVNTNGDLTATIYFNLASLVMSSSDQAPQKDTDPIVVKNLTFKKIGSQVTIPILYAMAEFKFSWDFSRVDGAMYDFNPAMKGNIGTRRYFGSASGAGVMSLARPTLAMGAAEARNELRPEALPVTRLAAVSSASSPSPTSPAPVTRMLAAAQPLTVDGIASIPGYSESTVHSNSQTLLRNIMFYHMTESDRITFLNYPKPSDLPVELGANLPQELKAWIHNTYAPAYISFMLSQIKREDSKSWRVNFDDNEQDKIWYWWTGQGSTADPKKSKCLANAKEYQQLNELTSAFAMRQLYGKTITPYLADGAGWAKKLFDGWSNDRALDVLMKPIINNGGTNLLNMRCNILHALDPKALGQNGYADKLFQKVVDYEVKNQNSLTYFPTEDPEGEAGRQWLYDGMKQLIVAVLNNDPSMDSKVRDELTKDLNALMKDMGIAAEKDADTKALAMLKNMDVLITNMSKWTLAVGKGIGALWGKFGFDLAGSTFDRAVQALPTATPFRVALFKGIATFCLAGMYIFFAWQTFSAWQKYGEKMPEAQKAQAVIMSIKWAVDIASNVYDIWKEYKTNTANPADQARTGQLMNQSTEEATMGPKGYGTFDKVDTTARSRPSSLTLKDSIAETVQEKGVIGNNDLVDEPTKFNEKVPKPGEPPAPGVPKTKWERFNTASNWFKVVGIVLAVALLVVMTIMVVQNWNNLNDAGKTLSVIQTIVTAVQIAVDIATVALEVLAIESVVLPVVGAILAIIGLAIIFCMMFIDTGKKTEPPDTPVEAFIKVQKPIIATWDAMPKPDLTYAMPEKVAQNTQTKFDVSATNKTGKDVAPLSVRVTVQGGSDDSCLLTDLGLVDRGVLAFGAAVSKGEIAAAPLQAGPAVAVLQEATTTASRSDTITSYDAIVQGVAAEDNMNGAIKLKNGQGFTVSFSGMVNKAGSNVVQIVETRANGDPCRFLRLITRA